MIGHWWSSPFGPVTDVMIEQADGHRRLIAPRPDVGDFIAETYEFDEVVTAGVELTADGDRRTVRGVGLHADITVGGRTTIGLLLKLVPASLASTPAWATMLDPIARRVMPGVRTRGRSGGRREWYGAHDLHRLTAVTASWNGASLGAMTDVVPPVRFGFGSTPRMPAVVRVTTTVDVP